jgi:two-component system, chemotaxis family, CheB/CheR fusion protein
MAFVLVQHLDPTHDSLLPSLLARSTPMPVLEATNGMAYQPDHVYVIPPNTCLDIANGVLRLKARPAERGASMPIDLFFRSLADNLGDRAMGVVLSGTGSDGTIGLTAIASCGGVTFAQDAETAQYPDMPRAAIQAGVVDFVRPPAGIAAELVRVARFPGMRSPPEPAVVPGLVDGSPDVQRVLDLMAAATGADLRYYKAPTLLRRLARRMLLVSVPDLRSYIAYVEQHPDELTALHNDILINVTSFFRDPDMLDGLARTAFPILFKDRRTDTPLRIWVPGCATGEEPYSIAIALLEYSAVTKVNVPIQIFATDLSEPAVARCRAGHYVNVSGVSPERLERFFEKTDRGYRVSKAIRDVCVFAKHNVLQDPPYSQLDLISCRNVLIYLRPEYQRRVFEIFHYALKPTGLLTLGRSETAGSAPELFHVVDAPSRIYANMSGVGHPRFKPGPGTSAVPLPPRAGADATARLNDLIHRVDAALAPHMPAAVVVDADGLILHFRGDTTPYLVQPPGAPTASLYRMARDPLLHAVRAALESARAEHTTVRRGPVAVPDQGYERRVMVEAIPLARGDGSARHFVVLFDDEGRAPLLPTESHATADGGAPPMDEAEGLQLRAQLRETARRLADSTHALESLTADYQSAHEEALSGNEELQSTNEELQTAKEELQSTNEELTTVNDELQARGNELTGTNNDLTNVLNSVHIPIILVGPDLRLRRFTPPATRVLSVIATDIGRPITDLTLNVAVPDLTAMVRTAIDTRQLQEREVSDHGGRWYSLRVCPYWTHAQTVDGAVILLVDISALRLALTDAKAARDYAEAIVTTVREPLVVLDDTLRVVTANPGFYQTFGTSPEQTIGRLFYELSDQAWDIPELRRMFADRDHPHGSNEALEVSRTFPQLGSRTVRIETRRIEATHPSLTLLAIEDVTTRRSAEAERDGLLKLAESARAEAEAVGDALRRLQRITDTALLDLPLDDLLDAVLVRVQESVPSELAVILLPEPSQDAAAPDLPRLLVRAAIGLDADERQRTQIPIGHGFAGRIAAERTPAILHDMDDAPDLGAYIRATHMRSLVGVPILRDAELLGVLHVGSTSPHRFGPHDVELLTLAAARIAHALEVATRRDTEARARQEAEAANRAKDEFIALLSHELRNPLSAVRNAITAARLDPSGHERTLALASRQADHLTRLVDDLLDVARITHGKIRLRRDRVMLSDAIERAVEISRPLIESRGHTLTITATDDALIEADPARLEQVVDNLLTNAAKYTPMGGQIAVTSERVGDEIVLRVRDNGLGIAPETLPHVFDLFAQGDTRLDRAQGGLGIGLTVVRRLVELHGGRVEAQSAGLGQGAEFTVHLPVLPPNTTVDPGPLPKPKPPRSLRVLVVEDNPDAAEAMQILLGLFGHLVRVAHDGPAALAAVQAQPPDIALVDIGLPGMDGYELVRHIREQPGTEQVVLVAMSGYGRDDDKERALAAGFHVHLTKPIDVDRLQALMAELVTPKPA